MAGGEIPVLTLLGNAAEQLRLNDRTEAAVFERILSRARNVAAGTPSLPDPAQLPEVVSNERVFGTNDMVDVGFLAGGLQVARAVALISVPRYQGGQQLMTDGGPWVSSGTAWLIAPHYAITNHHVINARLSWEDDADPPDFDCQATGATLRFDFDDEKADGVKAGVTRLVASSKALDYALVEVSPQVPARPVPRLAPSAVKLDATSRMAVNIIQHPGAKHKQVAFRNNPVSGADATTIRYFTDTDHGSSGSPVCDDQWRVVALHRGSIYAPGVPFQDKDEAFVNFGSQIQAVLADIHGTAPAAAEAIAAAQ
jgi:V8-like Glu-specific endopeptidase